MAINHARTDIDTTVRKVLKQGDDEAIDTPEQRKKPMKVLCLGMGRTGTTSLATALKQLGYAPYDFEDRFMLDHLRFWTQALRAKFLVSGTPWRREDFDLVTGDFDAILDIPCCLFVQELVEAYPDALVILNLRRDPDVWLESMNATLFNVFSWPSWQVLQYLEPQFCGRWYSLVMLTWKDFCTFDRGETCKRRYLEHNDLVRTCVPKDKLLEYEVTEGWEPLCRFLGVQEPERGVSFPSGNGREEFMQMHRRIWWVIIWLSLKRVVKVAMPVVVVMGAWWWCSGDGRG